MSTRQISSKVFLLLIIILADAATYIYAQNVQHYDRGVELLEKQKYDEALEEFMLELKDNNYERYCNSLAFIGYIYTVQKKYNEAIKYSNESLKLNPTNLFVIETLCSIYMYGFKDFNKGMEYCHQAEQLGSENATIYYNMACSYSVKNDHVNGLKYLDHAFLYGYRNIESIKSDIDLNNLKSDSRFISLLDGFNSIIVGDDYSKKGDEALNGNDFEKSKDMFKAALAEYEKVLWSNSCLISSIYERIGISYFYSGDYLTAILYLEKSKHIYSEQFGDRHKLTVNVNTKLNYAIYKSKNESYHDRELNIQIGHSQYIESIAYSPDGRFILSGSNDGTMKLWDITSGKEIRTYIGHSDRVTSVCFLSNEKVALSGSMDGSIKLWDIAGGNVIKTITGHSDGVTSVKCSSDGKFFLSGSYDKTIKLWDSSTGKEIKTFSGHSEPVYAVAITNDSRYVLSGSMDKTIKLWDVMSGKEVRTFIGHSDVVCDVSISPDEKYVLSGSMDKTIKLWDIMSGKELRTFSGHTESVISLAFSPDEKYILSGSHDKTMILWDIANGKKIKTFSAGAESMMPVKFSPDGKNVLSGLSNEIKIWDLLNGKEIKTLKSYSRFTNSMSYSSNLKYTISGGLNNELVLWDVPKGKMASLFHGHSGDIYSVAISPDGKYALSGSKDNTIKLWDISSGKEIRSFLGHSDGIVEVVFSYDGKYLFSGSTDNTMKLWDVLSGKEVRSYNGHSFTVRSVAVSPDDKYVLSGSDDKSIKLWDISSGKEIRSFLGHSDGINSVAFSSDGKSVLSGSVDRTIKQWDISSGKEIRSYLGHSEGVTSVNFSPDRKYVISGSYDGTIKFWDTATGEEIRTFSGHSVFVTSVGFSTDGKYIISGSLDKTTRIWSISTGAWVAFMSHSNGKDWLIFDSDGYWDASRYGGDLVAMVSGMDCWNIDQFAIKNNRPDLILAKLPNADKNLITEYNRQYRKRIAKLEKFYGIKESDLTSDMHVPKAEILKAEQKGKNISLSIKLTDSLYDIVSYNVYVNDVPVYTEIGKKIKRDKNLSITETIELTPGENKIEVSCFNAKGAESYRALSLASYDGKQKGNLYYIGFGVADYEDPTINDLKYSENDVTDLASKFSSMKNEYNKINIKTYTGKEVTATSIKAAKDFVKNASVDDTVILFISGHGMHDSDEFKTYYYLTQNTNMKNLKGTAADFDTVEDILAGINPRKKLFLMDTCDSGELDDFAGKQMIAYDGKGNKGIPRTPKGVVVDADDKRGYFDRSRYIYNDLFRRTGAVVFSSSKGGEVSWEYDSLKNGAFTEAMLDGLSGKADKDKNGAVSIDELQEFVSKGVINYTDDRQHPVIDRDNIYVKIELPVK